MPYFDLFASPRWLRMRTKVVSWSHQRWLKEPQGGPCFWRQVFPQTWKTSSVQPIFKNKGHRTNQKSYWPIALPTSIAKVLGISSKSSFLNTVFVHHHSSWTVSILAKVVDSWAGPRMRCKIYIELLTMRLACMPSSVWEFPWSRLHSRDRAPKYERHGLCMSFQGTSKWVRVGHTFGSMWAWQPKCEGSETNLLLVEIFA